MSLEPWPTAPPRHQAPAPRPPHRGPSRQENVSLADILSLRDSGLSEQEAWAVCLECSLSMRSVAHAAIFQTLCITPDTLAFNTSGNVCFMEQLSGERAEGLGGRGGPLLARARPCPAAREAERGRLPHSPRPLLWEASETPKPRAHRGGRFPAGGAVPEHRFLDAGAQAQTGGGNGPQCLPPGLGIPAPGAPWVCGP